MLPFGQTTSRSRAAIAALLFGFTLSAGAASAATCRDPAGFDKWLGDIRREAIARGISARAVDAGLEGVTFDQAVMRKDRGQGAFRVPFEQFVKSRVTAGRVAKAGSQLRQRAALFKSIEQRFGVPGEVIAAIWAMETDFGAVMGHMPVVRSVATLAYDCRRTERFTGELFAALHVLARGDLSAAEMKGAWAGEIGQTQFMISNYDKFGVDFDGDGRADLIRSVPDVLASTANYLKGHGWQRGAGWNPGEPNFAVIKEWNKSDNYARAIALFASKLAD
ncbi:MAG: lytic murein transglycosylase [Enterovirga sp.]|jgi:lytic murein transglycosylase|nr:lytic murein transglycosylase [Enterovirga sp.]